MKQRRNQLAVTSSQPPMLKRALRVALLGLGWVLIVALVSAVVFPFQAASFWQLDANSRIISAIIVGKDCPEHQQVAYSFEVHGQTYSGSRAMGEICGSAVKGQHINVYYDTLNPAVNTPYKPSAELSGHMQSVALMGIMLASFGVWRISKSWKFGKLHD